jgi:hypothetical protein
MYLEGFLQELETLVGRYQGKDETLRVRMDYVKERIEFYINKAELADRFMKALRESDVEDETRQ